MKKLYSLILVVILVVSLGACNSALDTTDYVTQDEFDIAIDLLNERYDNLIMSEGINGQVAYYENDNPEEVMYLSRIGFEYLAQTESDLLDETKFPEYIFNELGEYITVNDLGNLLTQKYFGVDSTTTIGYQYKMTIHKPIEITMDDFMARLSMMIIELSYYDFYTIDSPELYIPIIDGSSQYIKVRMSLLISDKYDLHPAIFWGGLMDTRIVGFSYNEASVEVFYNDYILQETYLGYVLPNYK